MLENFLREYNANRVFLSITGLWPFQNRYLRNILKTFFFLLEISYCPFELMLLYYHWDNPQMVFEGSYQLAMSMSFIGRQINMFWNDTKVSLRQVRRVVLGDSFYIVYCGTTTFRPNMLNRFHVYGDQLQRLYQTIDEHWNIFTNDTEVEVMKNYSTLSRKFTKYYSMLMFSTMLIFMIIPLTPILLDIVVPLNESRPRFFAVELELKVNKDDYFIPILCYTTIVVLVGATVVMSVDAMHIACTAHACSLFAAISKQLENINLKANNELKEPGDYMKFNRLNEEIIYREYIICLKKHQLAIKFVNTLDSTYQGLSLLLLVLLVGTISLISVRIIYVLNEVRQVIKYTFALTACLVTLMIVCYSSQRLMDESQSIFYRAYAAEWYKFSSRLKSLLIITLYRSNVPSGLKAGNMIPLSIATYAAVSKMRRIVKHFI
ncbi:hypothetical protein PUN28_011484 [Cardiocondyla obscurior]|uniref:Odorant receptor n=1 Tax=Cardiocondyla obscurior TaxID=286306 RepID=A0AAW2FJH5_9HYME